MALPWNAGRLSGTDAVAVSLSAWIRNQRRTRAWAAIAALWSVVFAFLLFRPDHPPQRLTLVGYLVLGAVGLGIAALAIVLAGRVARAGVWIGPDGIVIRGPFRTRSVALENAGRFVPGLQGGGGNGTPCPMLERRGGRAAGVWALGRRNIWFRYARVCQEIQPLCDELNALLDTLRPGSRRAE